MTHYRLRDKFPSAIVAINGAEQKIYESNLIYLTNGENFQLRFFNPLQEKLGVEINFNGQKTSNSLLVLRPGEDITLDRFLNESKKMRFETYNIDGNNPDAVRAAAMNGLVEIKFYKEESTQIYNSGGFYTNYNNITLDSCTTRGFCGGTLTSSIDYDSLNINCGSCNSSSSASSGQNLSKSIKAKKVETGRIEKGENSNQHLEQVDIKFQSYSFHTVTYQLKPVSERTQYANEIRQYCTECGYRIRNNSWKYCPKCSKNLSE